MKSLILLTVILLFSLNAFALDALPSDLQKTLTDMYPGATIRVLTSCELGSEKYPSYGIITKSDTLHALIAYKNNGAWQVTLIPKAASYQLGSTPNFLGDVQNSAIEPTDIRCTSPQTDPDISLKINGKYVAPFATHFSPEVKHLCFSASNTYNDWVCESINPSAHKVARTFIQMNAD